MTHIILRQKAIALRKQGFTYSEIKKHLQVPKSTLSDWLKTFQLEPSQFTALENSRKKNRYLAIEKIRITKQKKRDARLEKSFIHEGKRLLPLTNKQLEIAGLFLYWGEGSKNIKGPVSVSNTDPQVVKFTLYWLVDSMLVPKKKIHIFLHLYSDMDIENSITFWSNELHIPSSQFAKPYIKDTKRIDIDQKGFGYGTCTLAVNDVRLKEKIMMGIKSTANYYSEKIATML